MRPLLLNIAFIAGALASVQIRDGCSEDAAILATAPDSAAIQVRHGVIGETVPCYAVSLMQQGAEVRGFVLGTTLPAIQEFERRRASESRIPVPAPPASTTAEKKLPPLPPIGPSFESWSGIDTKGKRMQIVPHSAPVTLVTFWMAQSATARSFTEKVMRTTSQFKTNGMRSFGLIEGANTVRANYYLDDMGLDSQQALDFQHLAAKYGANSMRGTTLVVDASNQVVAISSNPAEIRAAVARVLAQ